MCSVGMAWMSYNSIVRQPGEVLWQALGIHLEAWVCLWRRYCCNSNYNTLPRANLIMSPSNTHIMHAPLRYHWFLVIKRAWALMLPIKLFGVSGSRSWMPSSFPIQWTRRTNRYMTCDFFVSVTIWSYTMLMSFYYECEDADVAYSSGTCFDHQCSSWRLQCPSNCYLGYERHLK